METTFLLAEASKVLIILVIIVGVIVIPFLIIFISFIRIWIMAFFSGAHVSLLELIGMYLRRVPREYIVRARIAAGPLSENWPIPMSFPPA